MTLSQTAKTKLSDLLPQDAAGFSVTGFVGTCRGSTPHLHPAAEAQENQSTIECEGLVFFVDTNLMEDFRECSIDYDGSFMGKGLTVTWPHRNGCACHS